MLRLDALFNVPTECAETEHLGFFIELFQTCEYWFYLVVFNDGDNGAAHGWPCMTAIVWITVYTSASLCLFHHGETSCIGTVENGYHVLIVCLVE